MNSDAIILRKLAWKYIEFANSEKNMENIRLHKAVNDLKPIRPVVLIDEIPWNEMNIDNELTLQCVDPYLRKIEWFLRSRIYKGKYMPADMVCPNFIPVRKIVNSTGIGITVKEKVLSTDEANHIVSHEYEDILQTEEDLARLHGPVLSYDEAQTMKNYNLVGEILADIIPVRLVGRGYFSVGPWDDIARYRGVTNLLMDLMDRPEFMHATVRKLTDIYLSELEQLERLGLLDTYAEDLHCTPSFTDDLPSRGYDGETTTRKDIWGRGFSQIFGQVSKAMHEEFDIEYMKELVGGCGLVYYGCCEPLDKKIDIVEKIPNLRKISVTPWADVDIAAEAINKKYVLSSKPNPSMVATPLPDQDALKKELGTILNACRRNGCACDIVLKDISTCCKRPQNIFEWEQIAMDMVRNY